MVNIPYHTARAQCRVNRTLYSKMLRLMVQRPARFSPAVNVSVFTLSCERDLPEQAACIYSFLRHVGTPKAFTIVSDGSYTHASITTLESIHPCVRVVLFDDFLKPDLPEAIIAYAQKHIMGKKLAVEYSMPLDGATIYMDSDVLFFESAKHAADLCNSQDNSSWYLPDIAGALDKRMLKSASEADSPANGGFMLIKQPLDWTVGMERLEKLNGDYGYFSEQTLMHLTLHRSGAKPLDPDVFILKVDDNFCYADKYAGDRIALRHYVSSVRHKFWQSKAWR